MIFKTQLVFLPIQLSSLKQRDIGDEKQIIDQQKYILNITTIMAEMNSNRTCLGNLLPERALNIDAKKLNQKTTTNSPNRNLNGLKIQQKAVKVSSHTNTNSGISMSSMRCLDGLKNQIEELESQQQYETKLRYEAQAFVLRKRRNNVFRVFQRREEGQQEKQIQEGAILFDRHLDRKKSSNKNSIKIQKLLNSFLSKGYEDSKSSQFLEFISSKHKIPLEFIKKTVSNLIGYVKKVLFQKQSDLRRIIKYQVDIHKLPQLGNNFDSEINKKDQQNLDEEPVKQDYSIATDFYQDGLDCFQQRQIEKGYVLPQQNLSLQWSDKKREIFKASRVMNIRKQDKQSNLKKLAFFCMKEVQKKYVKSIKYQNDNIGRAKKLHRQCLVYWRKKQKQLNQIKKRKQKLEAQLKKRDQEQQQAKKQQKRLQYIMYQSGLYSHFMATKLGVDGDQKKQLERLDTNPNNVEIDQQAAQLTVNQIINSKQENLQKFEKPGQKLDLSSVDQGKLSQLVGTPSSFHGTLKQYQIKGLRWLNNLFEQGINGILADQMGLGKTIQAIALLAHISQNKNVWGPFLIIAPNSTLFNWQQQFKKFCPGLRVLPYWGNIKQRKTIRKFFCSKKFTQKPDSPFHVVITSYQLTVTDQKTFKRMKWQFMILDQAQAIKNILSQRWNTLKQFQARNRLLLTGTPIQNNMAELWALLNFVMPDLFDSHQLFNQWFSKDIQAHSQDQKQLDQIKIQRLHAILKPFMLRRIKKDVEHQIGKKIQHQILCEMTKRQKLLYDSIKERLNVKELFKMFQSKAKVQNLMNLVMQLRKVCNHPELFERRPAISPFLFQQIYYYTGCIPIRAGDTKLLSFNSKNPIKFTYPKLAYDDLTKYNISRSKKSKMILNIYTVSNQSQNPTFSILRLLNLSKGQVEFCFREDELLTAILLAHWSRRSNYASIFSTKQYLKIGDSEFKSDKRFKIDKTQHILRVFHNAYIPLCTAQTIQPQIVSWDYYNRLDQLKNSKFQKFILQGRFKQKVQTFFQADFSQNFKGVISNLKSLSPIQVINFGNLIADSSKLRQLDRILKQKKQNSDKVLIFCQMTKMIDILEDFMNLRKYSFFRLDGACNIADRRDMVNQFQKPSSRTFVFLLSTRAGGLGVTLTAANTVIFYDNDWNPTMDAQATDRAHRIGQSRDVNVYQLVTKGTIQERIVKRAQQKKTVQSTVYEGASFNFFKKDMILQLMVDQFDQKNNFDEGKKKEGKDKKKGPKGKNKEQQKQKEQVVQIVPI